MRSLWRDARPVAVEAEIAALLATVPLRRVELCLSGEVDRPSVIGFFSPRVLIPEWLYAQLSAPELFQIVLHEVEHLRRADDWLNLLQKLSFALFPLNPALVWIERRLCSERELACDDGVPSRHAGTACLCDVPDHAGRTPHAASHRLLALAGSARGFGSELGPPRLPHPQSAAGAQSGPCPGGDGAARHRPWRVRRRAGPLAGTGILCRTRADDRG